MSTRRSKASHAQASPTTSNDHSPEQTLLELESDDEDVEELNWQNVNISDEPSPTLKSPTNGFTSSLLEFFRSPAQKTPIPRSQQLRSEIARDQERAFQDAMRRMAERPSSRLANE